MQIVLFSEHILENGRSKHCRKSWIQSKRNCHNCLLFAKKKKATHIAVIFLGVKVKRAPLVSKLIFLEGGLKSLSILCHKKKKLATWEPIKFNNNVPIQKLLCNFQVIPKGPLAPYDSSALNLTFASSFHRIFHLTSKIFLKFFCLCTAI